jgi:hypothetical protein
MAAWAAQGLECAARAIPKPAPFRYRCSETIRGAATGGNSMSKDELVIQLIKVALGIAIGGYFLWWSLEVLKRLPPVH